jgi:type IV pilus assembly protein PilC
MLKFSYVAKNEKGEEKKGEIDANEKKDVAESLRSDGFWLISLEEVEEKKKKTSKKPNIILSLMLSVPLKSKMVFCRHLAVMINSGVSISRALAILSGQEKNKILKKVTEDLAEQIKKGISLADAMAKYPTIFDQVFTSMVRVGEASGNLEEILKILAQQLEKDHKLISKVRGALIYPSIIVIVMVIIGIMMMMFVVPKITAIFDDFGADLPILTKIVLNISNFMSQNIILTSFLIVGFVAGVFFFWRSTMGKKFFHKVFLKAPILSGLVNKVNSARFARILSALSKSGVPLVKSLKITSDTLGNYYYKRAVLDASKEVQRGIPLSKVLEKYQDFFPYLVIQMIAVGEETGKTPEVLLKLAGFYEEEVDQMTKNLSSIIEPVLMVVVGLAVAFFAIAIIQPIYSIMDKV